MDSDVVLARTAKGGFRTFVPTMLFVHVLLFSLSGCAIGIKDHSDSAQHSDFRSACYEILMPSFLYEARCADLNAGGFGASKFCTGIQVFDPEEQYWDGPRNERYNYPASWEEYEKNATTWDKKMFHRLLFEKQRTAIAPIEAGTKFRIIGIYEYPRGEIGHVLVMRGIIASGAQLGVVVEIPSSLGFSDSGPKWVLHHFHRDEIQLNNKYLSECAE